MRLNTFPAPFAAPVALFVGLFVSTGCQNLGPRTPTPEPAPEVAPAQDPVSAAMASGDLDAASAALDELIFERELGRAREALNAGVPEDALVAVDRALAIHPRDPRVLVLKAEGSASLAERMIARGASAPFVEGAMVDALESYLALPATPDHLSATSEAAAQLDRSALALELARAAVGELPDDDQPETLASAARAHKAWGLAALRAFIAQRSYDPTSGAEDPGFDVDATFFEAEDALMRYLGFAPDEREAWNNLANLYLWAGDPASAAAIDARALGRFPGDRALLDALTAAAASSGPGRALVELEALGEGLPIYTFYTGRQRLLDAIPTMTSAPESALEAAERADAELARAASADESLAEEARGWRVISRALAGWALYEQEQLDAATQVFLTMEDLVEGGLAWRLEGSVRSGVDGLYFIGDQYGKRGDWERAAQTFGLLEVAQPNDSNWANNAGFFARDAAVALEAEGRYLCRAATGDLSDDRLHEELRILASVPAELAGTDAERAAFAAAAEARFARARGLAEASYASYLHASSLAPTDVRIVNDTALIQVYYLHEDLDTAEAYLLRAIAMGEEQLAADDEEPSLDPEARAALEEALGDAYQNMGVLHLMLLDDRAGAIPFLERSRDTGTVPRPLVTNALLPWCLGELDAPLSAVMTEVNWCAPCASND